MYIAVKEETTVEGNPYYTPGMDRIEPPTHSVTRLVPTFLHDDQQLAEYMLANKLAAKENKVRFYSAEEVFPELVIVPPKVKMVPQVIHG